MKPVAKVEHIEVPLAERKRREQIRWYCLLYIDKTRPAPTTEAGLLPSIRSTFPDATSFELRRALDYLELRGLLTVHVLHAQEIHLKLTYQGIDHVEYTSETLPGIGRPPEGAVT